MTTTVTRGSSAPARPGLWRITSRRTFEALRREGRRARRGSLSITWLPPSPGSDPVAPPQVAFAIGRRAGGAVVRNRLRRRLRAGLRELHAAGGLPGGAYLLGAGPALTRKPWSELVSELSSVVAEVTAEQAS